MEKEKKFILSEMALKSVERKIGLSAEKLKKMTAEDIDEVIEKRINKKLKITNSNRLNHVVRGSVFVFLNRLIPLEEIEKKLART